MDAKQYIIMQTIRILIKMLFPVEDRVIQRTDKHRGASTS